MTLAAAVAAAMFVGVIAYGLFGGADFGSGFYDLTAGSGRRAGELRMLVDHSIGPVWEANHVWLIYILVMWWTGFPAAFAAATTTLFIPLMLALAGIVLRGAGFAFRKYAATFTQARVFGAIFAASSVITPFFLGTVAGAIASGRVPADGYGDQVSSWVNPTSLVGGCLAVTTCAFLAGVFLTADAARAGITGLAERLRDRTLAVGIVTGLIVFAGLYPILHDAPTLSAGAGRAGRRHHHPPALSPKLLYGKDFRGCRGRCCDHRMGCGAVSLDAGRSAHDQRCRRRPHHPHRTCRSHRARRGHRAAAAGLSAVAHPDREVEPDLGKTAHTSGTHHKGRTVVTPPSDASRGPPPRSTLAPAGHPDGKPHPVVALEVAVNPPTALDTRVRPRSTPRASGPGVIVTTARAGGGKAAWPGTVVVQPAAHPW
jgi:hypothetical protein